MKSGNLNSWNPVGHSGPVMGLIYPFFTALFIYFTVLSAYLGLVLSVGIVYLPILVKYRIEIYHFCLSPHPSHMFEIMFAFCFSLKKNKRLCDHLISFSYTLYCTK